MPRGNTNAGSGRPADRRPATPPAADYHSWRTGEVVVRDRRFVVCSKPGMPEFGMPDVAAELLAQNLEVEPTDTVLGLNCGAGLTGVVAATLATDGRVMLADSNVVEVEATRRTLEANETANAEVHLSAGTSRIALPPCVDVVAARLPKGKLPTLQLIWDAYQALRPAGRFYLAGAKDEGIQSALRQAQALFGDAAVVEYRKGCRVGLAIKRGLTPRPSPAELERGEDVFADPLLDHGTFHEYGCEVRGRSYLVCSRPGVFSWDRLDAGSRALIEAMEIRPGEQVLDLGCGAGIVGVVAADLAASGRVYLVDADVDAVDSAERTVRANGRADCVALPSDSTSAVRDVRFDVVVTNPPFHLARATEYDVAHGFMEDAGRVLRKGGRFYVVANRFLPYESYLRRVFSTVETVFTDKQYKVLLARSAHR